MTEEQLEKPSAQPLEERCVWKDTYESNKAGAGTTFRDNIARGINIPCAACTGYDKDLKCYLKS